MFNLIKKDFIVCIKSERFNIIKYVFYNIKSFRFYTYYEILFYKVKHLIHRLPGSNVLNLLYQDFLSYGNQHF